jgi:hypothetical protein
LHCIDLIEAGAARALGLSWARDRKLSPLAQRFAEIIRACASEERARPLGQARRRTHEYTQVAKSNRKKSISK